MQIRIGNWFEIEVATLGRWHSLGVYVRAGRRDWWVHLD